MARKRKPVYAGLFDLRCEECGEYLIRTESGYLSCPMGHGKLVEEQPADVPPGTEEACGLWIEEGP
jgi:hypothetical protein